MDITTVPSGFLSNVEVIYNSLLKTPIAKIGDVVARRSRIIIDCISKNSDRKVVCFLFGQHYRFPDFITRRQPVNYLHAGYHFAKISVLAI